ncbi:uncharacterized protein LOC129942145 [Eupeodes corollae]|uniref:uncharacterized protein LOC129942145 n=1 Tax=Eupeodes corollae TaxID=290404 RepID=UPI0024916EB0|nr:uncharacterized protein LOC129942145 [Eupeodes corollae]
MKVLSFFIVLLVGLFVISTAKPQYQSLEPKVNYLKYSNEGEADDIIQGIIAQYQQLGGSSEFHNIPPSNQYASKK